MCFFEREGRGSNPSLILLFFREREEEEERLRELEEDYEDDDFYSKKKKKDWNVAIEPMFYIFQFNQFMEYSQIYLKL